MAVNILKERVADSSESVLALKIAIRSFAQRPMDPATHLVKKERHDARVTSVIIPAMGLAGKRRYPFGFYSRGTALEH